ncbi:hypothetical protein F0919_18105 [Taibaiella lutea]|uniref:Uncharacterized protein n=1 Tax=Taibaiella lutea TaxID=2608001 RepID=A0A5M6CC19_9BACT|nr:hypothetical protein [Taibaiella lutea]KAA5532694.1 hypothetical protein F0919_18105 [Taibaiella lutea]
MKRLYKRFINWIFYNRNAKRLMQDRRFAYLFKQLYACKTSEHLEAFRFCAEKVLQPKDYSCVRFKDLVHEIDMMDAFISKDEIRLQELRVEYGDYILRQSKLT